MNIVKYATVGLLLMGMATFNSCKKEDMSKYATKEDLNNYAKNSDLNATNNDLKNSLATSYDFSLSFSNTVTSATYQLPEEASGYKMYFVYLKANDVEDYVLLPYYQNNPGYVPVNYIAKSSVALRKIEVQTLRGDNQAGSPWTGNVTKKFRVVVLKTNGMTTHPNVDFSNYNEVSKAFNL